MKKLALAALHESIGAKMVDFVGFYMPVQYEGVNIEHETVRERVGVFDVSHMGELLLTGPHALDLIQRVTSNDASKLAVGKAQYSCLPNNKGGVVDDLLVYRIKEEQYLLVVNASNIDKDWDWISSHNKTGVDMRNLSDTYSLLAVQGPKAVEVMQKLTSVNLSEIEYYSFQVGPLAGIDHVIISATGYTGSGGFEIYCKNAEVEQIWNALFDAGKDHGIKPIGLAARDTLRLEMGYCLYGNDIDDTTSPIEAGLGWITKFNKDFVNSVELKNQKNNGILRKLIGFELIDRGVPRKGYEIVDENDNVIGVVTSGTMAPTLKKGIGMGYVSINFSNFETKIFVKIRNKSKEAKVVSMPFYKN